MKKNTWKSCLLMAVGSFFFLCSPDCPKSPELHFCFINSFIQPSRDTHGRHVSKKSEILGLCGRQNMLRLYLKIWDRDFIFGRAVKVISSLDVRSPWEWAFSETFIGKRYEGHVLWCQCLCTRVSLVSMYCSIAAVNYILLHAYIIVMAKVPLKKSCGGLFLIKQNLRFVLGLVWAGWAVSFFSFWNYSSVPAQVQFDTNGELAHRWTYVQ